MKNLSILFAVGLALFLTGAVSAMADTAPYGKVIDLSESNILIEYKSIGKIEQFLCALNTLACEKTEAPAFDEEEAEKMKDEAREIFRRKISSLGGTFIKISPQNNFAAYYISARNSNKYTRTFAVYNNTNGKISKKTGKIAYWDLLSEHPQLFSWSPDEKKVLYIDDIDGPATLYEINLPISGTKIASKRLFSKSYNVGTFTFWDNENIFFTANRDDAEIWSLYKYNLKTKKIDMVAPDVAWNRGLYKFGQYLVYVKINPSSLDPELYNPDTNEYKKFAITKVESQNIDKSFYSTDKFGRSYGVLMKPEKSNDSKTLLIWLHGGPYRTVGNIHHIYQSYSGYDFILENIRKSGVTVLKLDYAGSFGQGRVFSESVKLGVGTRDVADVKEALTSISKKEKFENVYLAGNSYGGYLALRAMVAYPKSFAGAVSINGVTDWQSLLLRIRTSIFNLHFNGLPNSKNKNLYANASIISRISRLTPANKILIIGGEKDKTISPSQSIDFHNLLTAQNKNSTLVTYPDEDHIFTKKESITGICKQMLAFLSRPENTGCEL